MNEKRPPIPAQLQRQVLVEAGHRCAIPTCKSTPCEIAHIIPWSKCREHRFENLIALCPNCHARYDNNKDIDRQSIFRYKELLSESTTTFSPINERLVKLEQSISGNLKNATLGFETAVADYSQRTCPIGYDVNGRFISFGLCTFVRPRVAIVPKSVLSMMDDLYGDDFSDQRIWEPSGISRFTKYNANQDISDLQLVNVESTDNTHAVELMMKSVEHYSTRAEMLPIITARATTHESELRCDFVPYSGTAVGYLDKPSNSNGIRGAGEYVFQNSYVAFRVKPQPGEPIRAYLTPGNSDLPPEPGCPVFRPDGALVGIIYDGVKFANETGFRPLVASLLPFPELWRNSLQKPG